MHAHTALVTATASSQTTCSFPLMKMILVHVVSCIVILAGEMLSVLRELLKTGNRKKRRS